MMWENFIARSRRASFVAYDMPFYPTLYMNQLEILSV